MKECREERHWEIVYCWTKLIEDHAFVFQGKMKLQYTKSKRYIKTTNFLSNIWMKMNLENKTEHLFYFLIRCFFFFYFKISIFYWIYLLGSNKRCGIEFAGKGGKSNAAVVNTRKHKAFESFFNDNEYKEVFESLRQTHGKYRYVKIKWMIFHLFLAVRLDTAKIQTKL